MKVYPSLPWREWIEYDEQGNANIRYWGVSFCDYRVVSEILQSLPVLKSRSEGQFEGDTWYMI
jgi:hypothetical protein